MKNLQKTANKFLKKLNGTITFDTVANYLNNSGYAIIYYSSPECSTLLKKYGLCDFQKTVNAFTYVCDSVSIVFINDKLPLHDMLCSLLHEAAHIYLGHLSINPFIIDSRRNEMEAEAFAYAVLNHKKPYTKLYIAAAIFFTVINLFAISFALSVATKSHPNSDEMVFLTPTGMKYHTNKCIYTKNKDCTAVLKTEADKCFNPCSVCNP